MRIALSVLSVVTLFAGCAQQSVRYRPMARVDTVFVDLWSNKCPACRCPTPEAAAAAAPRQVRSAAPAGPETWLWTALDSMVRVDYEPKGGLMGAMVMRTRDTMVVWSHSADSRMLPASTQKLWSNGAGLSELGFGFRWSTTLWMQGNVTGSVLHGNLLLEGGGDPTLGSPDGSNLSIVVNALAKKGIKEVRGNLIAVDTLVGRGQEAWPQGWTISSSRDGYGAPVLGLNWNQNRSGDRALTEPRVMALKGLRTALLDKKILVTGTDTTVRVRGDSTLSRRNWVKVGVVPSPTLENIVRVCLRESVNPFAEAIVLGMGMGRSRIAPREAGRRRMAEWAASKGFDPTKMVLDDGSGLSRYDLVTARQMAQLMAQDTKGSAGSRLVDFMAVGGQGTLRRRFLELPDRSLVIAKTGTLDGVSNLVGVLLRPGRDTLAFAFLCNGYTGGARSVRKVQDRLLALISGVSLTPLSASDTALEPPSGDPARPEGQELSPGAGESEAARPSAEVGPASPAPVSPGPAIAPAAFPDTASVKPASAAKPAVDSGASKDSVAPVRAPALLPEVPAATVADPVPAPVAKPKKKTRKKAEAEASDPAAGSGAAKDSAKSKVKKKPKETVVAPSKVSPTGAAKDPKDRKPAVKELSW